MDVYKEYNLKTFEDLFNYALQLAKEDKDEAKHLFSEYVNYIYSNNDKVDSLDEAEKIAKSNFGYFAGYYDQEVCDVIYKTYNCSHPIFGDKPFEISAEEAYKKGIEDGKKLIKNWNRRVTNDD